VKVDWLGLALIGLGFGCLQVMLDKGQQDDWFSSPLIVIFTMVTVICLVGAVVWERAHPNRSSTCGSSRTRTSPPASG
jgi:DHA2 family multidrug resistance protein